MLETLRGHPPGLRTWGHGPPGDLVEAADPSSPHPGKAQHKPPNLVEFGGLWIPPSKGPQTLHILI